ncbi:sialidase family protein [Streptomyces boetiae]|uniref:sialidase family protein n=1 Tax=Streptomyces boetiae TaxID=3075541 RepID=UPI00374E0D9F
MDGRAAGPDRPREDGRSTGPAAGPACESSVPFAAGQGGYAAFRIPAAVATPGGALLAFAEGRRDGAGDTGAIDVVARRSADGGCTWGPLTVVAAGGSDTRGNPTPVADPATGRVVLLTTFNGGGSTEAEIMRGEVTAGEGRRVFVQISEDDGRTFGASREITDDAALPGWRWYATGPGHGIALTGGEHAGRLVIPANHSASPPAGSPDTGLEPRYYGAHALISDDGGESWRIGYVADEYTGDLNPNESQVAELPDGRLYFSARDQNGTGRGHRAGAWSADGGESLEAPYAAQHDLDAVPVVQGSVLQLPGGPLLFSGPSVPEERRAPAVWRSDDGGRTFRPAASLSRLPAAYSDLVPLEDGTAGVLFETGEQGPYERIEFRRLGPL